MQFKGKDIPCGCEARKDIMFNTGGFGMTEGVILGLALVAVIAAWRLTP